MLEAIKQTAAWIKAATNDFTPEVGIILGTGLGDFGDKIEAAVIFPSLQHAEWMAQPPLLPP